mmetsp:Transcript_16273/g.49006  ORF Transcript_16273/g.49006 Transcript_16273/m.49006 type:complete len:324 (-) Transcript_16273:50-1021(-)
MVARSQLLIVVFAVGRGAREVPAWCHRSVESVAFFSAIHKSGTTLSAKGGLCFNAFLDRADVPIGVNNPRTSVICGSNFPAKISQSVTWTRDPFDWIVSNYMYDRRGNEENRFWFPAVLGDPVFAADLAASLPGFNYSALPGEKFDAWLKRLPLVEGLAFELFLRMNRPDVAAYIKRTDPIHFPANLGELLQASGGERIGPDAAPSSASRVSVCLEDFMSDPARTHRTWRNVLQAVAPGAVPDAVLEQCIADHDTTASQATFLNNTRSKAHPHGTYRTVSPTELDGMLKMARGLDAGFLGGTYAAAAQRIGCNTTRAARRRFV